MPDLPTEETTEAVITRTRAFDAWYEEVILGTSVPDVAHEAFCAGWEAARPEITWDVPGGLHLSRCTCQCRQCGYSKHCSACYKERRATAFQRLIDKAARAERKRVERELWQEVHRLKGMELGAAATVLESIVKALEGQP